MDFVQAMLLLGVGAASGFINIIAGGGSSLTLPAMILMGLDSTVANGTNRVAICIQSIVGIAGFHKQEVNRFGESLKFSLVALPGATLGALIAVKIDSLWFQRILGIVMLAILVSMIIPLPNPVETEPVSVFRKRLSHIVMFGVGFYGGFIQVGVGFLIMAILYHGLRLNLVDVNVHKVFIVFMYTLPALAVFIWNDKVNWLIGLTLAIGSGLGGWVGAHVTVKGGEKAVRRVLMVVLLAMSIKLLDLF